MLDRLSRLGRLVPDQLIDIDDDGLQHGVRSQVQDMLGQVRSRVVDVPRPAHRARHEIGVARLVPAHADVRAVQMQDAGPAQPVGVRRHGGPVHIEQIGAHGPADEPGLPPGAAKRAPQRPGPGGPARVRPSGVVHVPPQALRPRSTHQRAADAGDVIDVQDPHPAGRAVGHAISHAAIVA